MKTWVDGFDGTLDALGATALALLPRVAGALLVVLLGWLIARALRWGAYRLVRRLGRIGAVERELEASGIDDLAPKMAAAIVFWIVFVLFVAAAGQVVGLTAVTAGLSKLAQYLPSLLAAVVVLGAGVVLGNLARAATISAAQSARVAQPVLLGSGTRIGVLAIAAVIAVEQIGLNSTVLVVALGLVAGGGVAGSALAFGLGSRAAVGNLIVSQYLLREYRPGQIVRIGDIRGRIVELKRGCVVLETDEGRALVPAKLFEESTSVRMEETES